MKKVMAIALALLLLCAGAGLTEGWREGTSPAKPYIGSAELDLDESLGYMMVYPNNAMNAMYSCQYLYVYLPRTDVKAGDGTLYLCTNKDGEIWRTAMNDAEVVSRREMVDEELDALIWAKGTCFEIKLPKSLKLGESYFVNMGEGCIVTEGKGLKSGVVGGTDLWRFEVTGDYGVSEAEYLRDGKTVAAAQAGDELHCTVELGGDAAMAVLYSADDGVVFVENTLFETTEVTGEVTGDSPSWGVIFLNANGEELEYLVF